MFARLRTSPPITYSASRNSHITNRKSPIDLVIVVKLVLALRPGVLGAAFRVTLLGGVQRPRVRAVRLDRNVRQELLEILARARGARGRIALADENFELPTAAAAGVFEERHVISVAGFQDASAFDETTFRRAARMALI